MISVIAFHLPREKIQVTLSATRPQEGDAKQLPAIDCRPTTATARRRGLSLGKPLVEAHYRRKPALSRLGLRADRSEGGAMRMKFVLTLADAKRVAAAAAQEALRNGWSVVIAIVDDAGLPVYLERLDGVQPASCAIAQHKARAAALFRRSTKTLEESVAGGRVALLSLPHVTPVEGGLPLLHEGQVIGAIGVSGVQSFEDGIVAKAGVDALAPTG
jgi:glc operon protein GlcG